MRDTRRTLGTMTVVLMLALVTVPVLANDLAPGGTFNDDDGNTHEANIEAIAAAGITKGCNPPVNDMFCPDEAVTRGQMAAFLHRALEGELDAFQDLQFVDIAGSTFEADIEWLGATGVTKGCNPPDNDMFCPDENVTRGEMAAFLVRALSLPDAGSAGFVDAAGHLFEADIDRLAAAGITKGCNPPDNDMFCPDEDLTRAEMATFLTRALDLEPIQPPPPTTSTTMDNTSTSDGNTTTTDGSTPTTEDTETHDVEVGDNFFADASVVIDAGDTVEWTWVGVALHTVTSGEPGDIDAGDLFDSSPAKTSGSFQHTFSEPGTFQYFCSVHGPLMTGEVVVEG